ncbi:MAG TPA: COR domain-containing protein [Chthoniobacterales bacterium]|nr:COR domain-containing protein [Chthoniobacterales bacterium]
MSKDATYQEAERKIDEARRSKAKKLDLSSEHGASRPKLSELPESLGQLTQLQSLDLSGNKLTALPESLSQLTQLQSLNLSSNQLTALPKSLSELTQLQSLDLSRNQLTIVPKSLGELTQLQTLDLSNNQLTVLPESLGQLTKLQTLNLSSTRLKVAPEWLGQLVQLRSLDLSHNELTILPECVRQLVQLQSLDLSSNQLTILPKWVGQLTRLQSISLYDNQLAALPDTLGELTRLRELWVPKNNLKEFPEVLRSLSQLTLLSLFSNHLEIVPTWIVELHALERLDLDDNEISQIPDEIGQLRGLTDLGLGTTFGGNRLTDLPPSLAQLEHLTNLDLDDNPLNPELAAAYKMGLDAIKRYLRAKAAAKVVLNEAKLILVGEGEVGKSSLLGALRGDPWQEGRPTTHGIEIKPVKVIDPATATEITLNGWDFGGQRVYRPTHQLFFSAPAVYLVVWKPREGPQQGFVKEWIKLVKHREPEAKILVVATHGGPEARQPDIDRQEIWDLFGENTVIDFFHVDCRPPEPNEKNGARTGACKGIEDLKNAIAKVAASLPEVGRSVPKHWQEAREALRTSKEAYLPLDRVYAICKRHKVDEEDASLLIRICHRVGDLIHYEHDPVLRNIVVLKPDWLATAVSFVLDDENTRHNHGLVTFRRLGQLWNHRTRAPEFRYPAPLHSIFLRLMERFDLSYRIAEGGGNDTDGTSLIAQLVPDVRPETDLKGVWPEDLAQGDEQQLQICRIVETANNQSATAEGLFYQLIVRLHKFSLGRANFRDSVHWQRGLVVEDDTGARAFLEHIGNDVRITVRSPYPPRFLSALTYEVKWLVESFWGGLRCDVTVPCLVPLPNGDVCKGLFEVGKLLENKKRGRPEQPCPICNEWQNIDQLLDNAPAARANPIEELLTHQDKMMQRLDDIRVQLAAHEVQVIGRFDRVDATGREIVSKVEDAYTALMRTVVDEAKEGPRLFSFEPAEPGFFDRPKWISAKFRLTLWCEHSRRPLWFYSDDKDAGAYTIDLPREWLVKAAPFLKVLSSTLGLLLPVVAATAKVALPETSYKGIEAQLALGKATAESLLKGGGEVGEWLTKDDGIDLQAGTTIRAEGGVLRQLHAWLKEEDPTFGGLVRVQNKRQEFLWVHPSFEAEY